MSIVEVLLLLESSDRSLARVRVWVDPAPSSGFESETELHMTSGTPREWRGEFKLPSGLGPEGFLYRVGLCAPKDATWAMRFIDQTSGRLLLADSDTMPGSKCYLVGQCSVS